MIYFCRKQVDDLGLKHEGQTEAAKKLLLAGLRLEYGMEELPQIEADRMGKPYFTEIPQLFFNYSHCREGILCGISRAPVGVDIEMVRSFRESLVKKICHPEELSVLEKQPDKNFALTRIWVAKEAYLKYTGTGIRSSLKMLDMSSVLKRDIMYQGESVLRLWNLGKICMCVCSEERNLGEPLEIEI